jgi:hypothetical protein
MRTHAAYYGHWIIDIRCNRTVRFNGIKVHYMAFRGWHKLEGKEDLSEASL